LLTFYEFFFKILLFCNLLNDIAVGTSIFFRQNLFRVKNVADINQVLLFLLYWILLFVKDL
jgi:hypothetical protein